MPGDFLSAISGPGLRAKCLYGSLRERENFPIAIFDWLIPEFALERGIRDLGSKQEHSYGIRRDDVLNLNRVKHTK